MTDQVYKSISNMRVYCTKLDDMLNSMKQLTDFVNDEEQPESYQKLLQNSEELAELYLQGIKDEFEFYKLIKKENKQ